MIGENILAKKSEWSIIVEPLLIFTLAATALYYYRQNKLASRQHVLTELRIAELKAKGVSKETSDDED